MGYYFEDTAAIAENKDSDIETVITRIAMRYMRKNPRADYTARPYMAEGIQRNRNYRYAADFSERYPDAPAGSYVYARGIYRSQTSTELRFMLIPSGPVKLWLNGTEVYATDIYAERYEGKAVTISLKVKKGINRIVLRFTRTPAGFGGEFGTWLGKLDYFFTRGLPGYTEMEGIDYTRPFESPVPEIQEHPEKADSFFVSPREWSESEYKQGCFGRIYGTGPAMKGQTAAAVTTVSAAPGEYTVSCTYTGDTILYADGKEIRRFTGSGTDSICMKLSGKKKLLVLYSTLPRNRMLGRVCLIFRWSCTC